MNKKLEAVLSYSKEQLYDAMHVDVKHQGSDGYNEIYLTNYRLLDTPIGSGSFLYQSGKVLGWRRFHPLSTPTLRNPRWEESAVTDNHKLYLGSIAHVKTLLALEEILPDTNIEVEHQLEIKPEREAQLKAMQLKESGMKFNEYLGKSKSYLTQKGFNSSLMRTKK